MCLSQNRCLGIILIHHHPKIEAHDDISNRLYDIAMGRCETWKRWKTDTQYEVHPDSEQGHICDRPALQGKSQVDRARHYAGG